MPIDAIVRVSFDGGDPRRNQAANLALVGHQQDASGSGAFARVGTALYTCSGGSEFDVTDALIKLSKALRADAGWIDFVSINIYSRR